MAARFLKRLAGHFANETAVATPNGKVLAQSPTEGLAQWEKLPEQERQHLDDLGAYDPKREPAPPAGGLILKVYARGLTRDAEGRWQIYRNARAHLSQEPGRDHLWLTQAEWRSLVPADPKKGARAAVPEGIVDRFCRRYLIDLVRIGGEGGPHRAQDVRAQKLSLLVDEVTAADVKLRLEGSARFVTHGREHGVPSKEGRVDAFQLLGFLRYDRQKRIFTRFDVVALSATGHYDEIGEKLLPLGVAFELAGGATPADRVRPHSLHDHYFGTATVP
jgi:hypothetical protein